MQEILHEASATQNQSTRTKSYWNETATPTITGSDYHIDADTVTICQNYAENATSELTDDDQLPVPQSDSYVIPGSGSLKETHIFTPSKVPAIAIQVRGVEFSPFTTNNSTAPPPPSNLSVQSTSSVALNPIKFQTLEPSFSTLHLENSNGKAAAENFSNDFSELKTVTTPDVVLNNFTINSTAFAANAPSSFIVAPVAVTECSDYDFQQAAAGIIIDENVVKKEYRDLEYHAPGKINATPTTTTTLDDFSDFQQSSSSVVPSVPNTFGILQPTPATTTDCSDRSGSCGGSGWSKPTIGISPTENMFASLDFVSSSTSDAKQIQSTRSADDDFNDFQSNAIVPPPLNNTPSIQQQPILVPQSTTFSEPSSNNSINWPAPGIDPDEMARLEAIFPANKQNQPPPPAPSATTHVSPQRRQPSPDDEWSDFVSGTFAPQPITSIIDQTINKHQADDDDWSEFVSSQPKLPAPNFPAWNAAASGPPQFGSWHTATAGHQFPLALPQQSPMHVPTISGRTAIHQQNAIGPSQFAFGSIGMMKSTMTPTMALPKAPSISSITIPDLGFASVHHRSVQPRGSGGGGAATKK